MRRATIDNYRGFRSMLVPPLVSVLIRTKDRQALLLEAVASAVQQTHPALEIIIVNDGGADVSAALPGLAPDSGRRLQWLNNTGQGRSAAANTALLAASGDFCLFLDDDDWLDPPHITNLLQALQAEPDCILAYSAVRTVAPDGSTDESSFRQPFDPVRLLVENYIPIHAALFRQRLITQGCRFDTGFDRYEDWDFWLQALEQGSFCFVPSCSANYRIGAGSGFGATPQQEIDAHRATLYRKWLPRWDIARTLALLDRSRAWPQLAVVQAELEDTRLYLEHLKKVELEQREELVKRAEALEIETAQVATLNHELQSQANLLGSRIATLTRELGTANAELLDTENQLAQTEAHLQQSAATVDALHQELATIYNSRSWKLTRPLRLLAKVRAVLRSEGPGGLARRIHYKLFYKAPPLPETKSEVPVAAAWQALDFPPCTKPLISIVIPVYNKYEYTFHCLQALLANSGDQPYEVIVVDDCSTDATPQMLAAMSGIRVLRNEQNSGFIHSCNSGARAARGDYLLLLNNDTEVQPAWLSALLHTFRDFPDAGMVGARLLFADGKLQEAGGIVWRDGSAWNYGRGDDPNKPEYAYVRRVDYCSGACLLLPLADFMALGMFDTHYAPAYYEDTDLAFKVRAAGKQVYYQPLARVIHFEGISNGTDTGSGVKEYQVRNQQLFFTRWEEVLRSHRPNGRLPHLEKERHVERRVLVVDARVLMPDHDSGSLRMFNLLKIFQRLGFKVSFIPDNLHYHEKYTPLLQSVGIECFYFPYLQKIGEYLEHFGSQYQVVLLSRADFAEKHIDAVLRHCPQAQVLFDTVDLHFLREQRQAALSGDKLLKEAAELRRLQELGLARKAQQTLVVSPVEVELFRQEAPDVKVALLSNIHAAEGRQAPWQARKDILFIGSFEHPPNADAMHWFIDEVFPLLRKQKPDITLRIVGGGAPKNLLAKAGPGIEFTGFVDDIAPLFNSIRLSVAPLRYGAGVKGKINSSMSYGVPVVGTTVAAEGMGLVHGADVLIADTAADFVACILRAYDDEQLWYALSNAGLANIERCFSFEVATQQLQDILGLPA